MLFMIFIVVDIKYNKEIDNKRMSRFVYSASITAYEESTTTVMVGRKVKSLRVKSSVLRVKPIVLCEKPNVLLIKSIVLRVK